MGKSRKILACDGSKCVGGIFVKKKVQLAFYGIKILEGQGSRRGHVVHISQAFMVERVYSLCRLHNLLVLMSAILRVRQSRQNSGIFGVQGSSFLQYSLRILKIVHRQSHQTEIQKRSGKLWVQLCSHLKLAPG